MKKTFQFCIFVFLEGYIPLKSFADEFIPVDLSEKCTIEGYVTVGDEKAPKTVLKLKS